MRKTTSILLSVLLVLLVLGMSAQNVPAYAQGGPKSDFAVSVDISGVVQSITASALTLTDTTTFKITKNTNGVSSDLQPGVTVTVTAGVDEQDEDNLVAL